MLEGARSPGIPTFVDQNGIMMEGEGGCALSNVRIREGKRLSIFRTYVYPHMDRPNLTVLTDALVTRVLSEGRQAMGVEAVIGGQVHPLIAGEEVILSLEWVSIACTIRSGLG